MILKDIVNIKKLGFISLFFFIFVMSFSILSINNVSAGLECEVGSDDCDCDGICEMEVSSDPLNCGKCGNVCSSNNCVNSSCSPVIGGLVPCGRMYDNPDTVWNEQESCKICHAVPLMDSIIEYLLEIVALITVLAIIIGGILYVSSAGDASRVTIAKTAVTKSLLGFIFVLVAWVIVNIGMVIFGFNDPLGDGSWAKFNCNLVTTPINSYCGDGLVDNPNSDGINETCDPQELKNDFITRTGLTGKEWVEKIYNCNPATCTSGCADESLVSQIGEGCYNPVGGTGNPCQKGQYICDHSTNTVVCKETFNDPTLRLAGNLCSEVYDYCCNSNAVELADGDISGAPFEIVRADVSDLEPGATGTLSYSNLATGLWSGGVPNGGTGGWGAGIGFRCDNVCKNVGKICVGVGFTDPSVDSCVYVKHDEPSVLGGCNNNRREAISMQLPANQASTNCDAWFSMFYYSNKNGTGRHWSTGYDKYVYYCADNDLESYWNSYGTPGRYHNFNVTPNTAICRPTSPDTCDFHGFDLIETACYCI